MAINLNDLRNVVNNLHYQEDTEDILMVYSVVDNQSNELQVSTSALATSVQRLPLLHVTFDIVGEPEITVSSMDVRKLLRAKSSDG